MKYRFTLILAVLLLLPVLTGCACSHEWLPAGCEEPQFCAKCEEVGEPALGHDWGDATCTEPQTCARCGVTGQPALGHDWIGATCTDPETCSRCSATQGEALGHSFGDWTFGEDDMTHACSVCSFEETVGLDQELYLETLLSGHWDYFGEFTINGLEPASSSNIVGLYLSFGDGRTVTLKQATTEAETGTWELTDLREVDDTFVYYIDISLETVTMTVVLYHEPASPDNDLIAVHQTTFTPVFSKNTEGVALVTGNWAIKPDRWGDYRDDPSFWVSFREDRTVTFDLGSTREGIWHLVPMTYSGYTLGYGIVIEYDDSGETEYLQGTLLREDLSVPESPYELTLKHRGRRSAMIRVDDAEFETVRERIDPLLGKWTSTLIAEGYSDGTGTVMTDYSITFHDDGTFTADLDREYTGTWYVDHIPVREDGKFFYYDFCLYFDGQKEEAYCHLEVNYGETELTVRDYPGSNDTCLHFAQMSDEEADDLSFASALAIGTWVSFSRTAETSDGAYETTETADHSITFYENGTFTALLDEEVTGTWTYQARNEHTEIFDGAEQTYFDWEYSLSFQGGASMVRMYITQFPDSTILQIYAPHPEAEDQVILYGMARTP